MNSPQLNDRLHTLLAKATGRPRWLTGPTYQTALFSPAPAESTPIPLSATQSPVQTHLAAEAALQTDALLIIATALVAIVAHYTQTPPETKGPNP